MIPELDELLGFQELKSVKRHNEVEGRPESCAEHSWSACMLALLLHEHIEDVDLLKVIKMLLIHDLCEIVVGDQCLYDVVDSEARNQAERDGAAKFLSKYKPLLAIWQEFDERRTLEARFANFLDKLDSLLQHMHEGGVVWRREERREETIRQYNASYIMAEYQDLFEEIVRRSKEADFLR